MSSSTVSSEHVSESWVSEEAGGADLNTGSDNPLYDRSLPPEERLARAEVWYEAQIGKITAKLEVASEAQQQLEAAEEMARLSEELSVLASHGGRILEEIDAVADFASSAEKAVYFPTNVPEIGEIHWPPARETLESIAEAETASGRIARKLLAGEAIDWNTRPEKEPYLETFSEESYELNQANTYKNFEHHFQKFNSLYKESEESLLQHFELFDLNQQEINPLKKNKEILELNSSVSRDDTKINPPKLIDPELVRGDAGTPALNRLINKNPVLGRLLKRRLEK